MTQTAAEDRCLSGREQGWSLSWKLVVSLWEFVEEAKCPLVRPEAEEADRLNGGGKVAQGEVIGSRRPEEDERWVDWEGCQESCRLGKRK